jgi:DNA mismatch repair protein MutS2
VIAEKTLHTLEFDKIVRALEEHATFSVGKEAALALRPATDMRRAQAYLDQTAEARLFMETHPSVHLGGAHDIRPAVRRAEVGAILTPAEFLEIGSTLGASARVRSGVLKSDIEIPWLRRQASAMDENRELVKMLEQIFSERGEILDSASTALRRIRSEMKTAEGRLLDRLNSMVTSPENKSTIQEPIVTMRNGRYVIPVRAEARSKMPGVVHDQSSSGATVFVEPLVVTEMNNHLKELQLAEQREIERILHELSGQVAGRADELRNTVDALGEVDLAMAKAKYAGALRAASPRLNQDGRISLASARHPLLRGNVVPISVEVGIGFRVLVITGPNTGGKTVALKTTGLLCLMAMAGMHVPAAPESELAVFSKVFADIGDEQSIEQSLSTFSSHMRNIIGMLPEVDAQSLVLLDELGAGTDPAEGSALARAILTSLLESNARAVVTTHFSELKSFAHETDGLENASVEFNVRTLSPTYRLTIGLPGRSQAMAIAKRLGMPDAVLVRAQQNVSQGAVRVEKFLAQIQSERRQIGRLFERAKQMHDDTRKLRERVQGELQQVATEREAILGEVRLEAAGIVRELRARLRQIEREAKGTVSRRDQRGLQSQVEEAQVEAAQALGPLSAAEETGSAGAPTLAPIRQGSTVQILSLGQQGDVLGVADGQAEVQVGNFKMRVPVEDLQALSRKERSPERAIHFEAAGAAPKMEIDLRGWRADDAMRELDQYLHDNYVHGHGTVRVIHGKGTGALRAAIRDQLSSHPLVKSAQAEESKLGGEGVTVVNLAV